MKLSINVGFLHILTLIFIFLKLSGKINWSWWLVLSPTLVPIVLFVVVFSFVWLLTRYIIWNMGDLLKW